MAGRRIERSKTTPSAAPESKRRRRSPEQAQREILDAAERLIIADGPDAVGLQAVASEAGVSHALITHYFGTYEGLVGEVLAQCNARLAERVGRELLEAGPAVGTVELMDRFFAVLSDPALARLRAWALLTGRQAVAPLRGDALERVIDALTMHAAGVATARGQKPPTRERIESALWIGLAASQWWALSRGPRGRQRAGVGIADGSRLREALGAMLSYWVGV